MRSLLLFASIIVIIACKSGSSSGSIEEGCERYFSALLDYQARCSGQQISRDGRARLLGRVREYCSKVLTLPGSNFSASTLDACTGAVNAATCERGFDDDACKSPPGSLADGATCQMDFQCVSLECNTGTTISSDGGISSRLCGTCQARIAVGGQCNNTDRQCVEGATCVDGTCQQRIEGDVGAVCGAGAASCKDGLVCQNGKCAERLPAGSPCDSGSDCARNLYCKDKVCSPSAREGEACGGTTFIPCESGFTCTRENKCVRRTYAAAGQPCGNGVSCEQGSCNSAGGATGTCPNILADGAPCNPADRGNVCDEFASCVDGKCTMLGTATCP